MAGGLGSRIQKVLKDKPKCLAPINGKPFIDILLDDCINQGMRRFILCVGHLKEQIIKYLSNRNDCEIVFSEEDAPLGTGGALKNAKPHINSDPILVMNGDSYIKFSIQSLIKKQHDHLASILIYSQSNSSDFGHVELNKSGLLMSFNEKIEKNKSTFINGGRYVFSNLIFDYLPSEKQFSLEYHFFPELAKQSLIISLIVDSKSFDIGTPARLFDARAILKRKLND